MDYVTLVCYVIDDSIMGKFTLQRKVLDRGTTTQPEADLIVYILFLFTFPVSIPFNKF